MVPLRTALIALLIFLPWLARNYILSGYLAFPFSATGLFHPDWQVPADAVKMEINYIAQIPKTESDFSPVAVARSRTLFSWFPGWVQESLRVRPVDILFLFMALLSPLYWLLRLMLRRSPAPLLAPWAFAFVATIAWLETSPVFRFGAVYICMTYMLPAFDAAYAFFGSSSQDPPTEPPTRLTRWIPALMLTVLTLSDTCYIYTGLTRHSTYRFTLADCWLRPLRSRWYNDREKLDFPYRILKSGTKMYMADDSHFCINVCLPCMQFNYGKVEMRGTRLDEGFRVTADEVRLHYPDYLK